MDNKAQFIDHLQKQRESLRIIRERIESIRYTIKSEIEFLKKEYPLVGPKYSSIR